MDESTQSLFDRFTDEEPRSGFDPLVRDITDIIGARRLHTGQVVGLMNWGLRNTFGLSPSVEQDRQRIASQIQEQLSRFEPRLKNVRVRPLSDATGFTFEISADVQETGGDPVYVRVIAPRCGGGLGAEVLAVG